MVLFTPPDSIKTYFYPHKTPSVRSAFYKAPEGSKAERVVADNYKYGTPILSFCKDSIRTFVELFDSLHFV